MERITDPVGIPLEPETEMVTAGSRAVAIPLDADAIVIAVVAGLEDELLPPLQPFSKKIKQKTRIVENSKSFIDKAVPR